MKKHPLNLRLFTISWQKVWRRREKKDGFFPYQFEHGIPGIASNLLHQFLLQHWIINLRLRNTGIHYSLLIKIDFYATQKHSCVFTVWRLNLTPRFSPCYHRPFSPDFAITTPYSHRFRWKQIKVKYYTVIVILRYNYSRKSRKVVVPLGSLN